MIAASSTYKFRFYCSATLHVTSQVLQPKSLDKLYRRRQPFISGHRSIFCHFFELTNPLPRNCLIIPKICTTQPIIDCSNTLPRSMIMKESEYFPNPDVFDPDNFNQESKANRSPYAFFIFGQGPRNCIGMRFGLLQVCETRQTRTLSIYFCSFQTRF